MEIEEKKEGIRWIANARIEKWHDSEDYLAGSLPDEVTEQEGNLLTTVGLSRLEDLLIGAGGQAYDNTHSRIGVGNGSTGATTGDTDLAGASKQFQVMDATYPSRSGTVITFQSTYDSTTANFAWNEWGIDNGTSNGTTVVAPLLNRKVASLGTKSSGSTWVFIATIQIA